MGVAVQGGEEFAVSCGASNMSVRTNCGSIRLVGRCMGRAVHTRILKKLNKFSKTFSLTGVGRVRRPILLSNASKYKAGMGLTVMVSGRSAVKVSTITVYIGSVTYTNKRPLFFLSCVTYKGGCPRGVTTVMGNITRKYGRSSTTLVNKRATRRPKLVPRSRCSLTKFTINIYSGGSVVAKRGLTTKSILVKVTSANIRDGKFSLMEGMFSVAGRSLSACCSSLKAALKRTLLTPAEVCMGTLGDVGGTNIAMGTYDRVANNKFCRGVPHVLGRKARTIMRGSDCPVPPVFTGLTGRNRVRRRVVCGAFGVKLKVILTISPTSISGAVSTVHRTKSRPCMINGVRTNRGKIALYWRSWM